MVSKLRTHNKFSFSVRMKRSATPLPSGSRTKLGELSMPKNAILLKVVSQIVRPVVVPKTQPAGDASPIVPKRARTPWRIGSRASNRVPRLAACRPMHSVVQ